MLSAAALVSDLKHVSTGMLRFFCDEKNVMQGMKRNRQNDRWLAESPDEVPIVTHSKYPAHVMVLEVISSEGDVMERVFVSDGLCLNANDYIGLLDQYVKSWMDRVEAGRLYVFQQDSPPHTRPGSLTSGCPPTCHTTVYRTYGLPHRQTGTPSTILCAAFWRRR